MAHASDRKVDSQRVAPCFLSFLLFVCSVLVYLCCMFFFFLCLFQLFIILLTPFQAFFLGQLCGLRDPTSPARDCRLPESSLPMFFLMFYYLFASRASQWLPRSKIGCARLDNACVIGSSIFLLGRVEWHTVSKIGCPRNVDSQRVPPRVLVNSCF